MSEYGFNRLLISVYIIFALFIININGMPIFGQVLEPNSNEVTTKIENDDNLDNDTKPMASRATIDTITEITLPTDSGDDKYVSMKTYNNKLYVAWSSNDPGITSPTALDEPDYDIVIRSFDGQNWSAIFELSPKLIETKFNSGDAVGTEDDYFPNLIVYKNKLYAFWVHSPWEKDEPSIIRMRSYDGVQWSNVINFSYGGKGDGVVYNNKLCYGWYGKHQYENPQMWGMFFREFDGIEWTDAQLIDSEYGMPTLEVDNTNNLLFACWGNSENFSAKIYDGNIWKDKFIVDDQKRQTGDYDSYHPNLSFFNNKGHIIWSDFISPTTLPGMIKLRNFRYPNINLSKIIQLNRTREDQYNSNPKLINFKNKLFAGWDCRIYQSGVYNIGREILIRSFDGNNWDDIKQISPNRNYSFNSHIQLIEFKNTLYIVWQTNDSTISNSNDWDIVIRPLFGSFLKCEDTDKTVEPGKSVIYVISVSNIAIPKSKSDYNLKLETSNIPHGWIAKLEKSEINLDLSETIKVKLTITAPFDATIDQWANISVICRQKDIMVIEDSIETNTYMDVKFDVDLTCREKNKYIIPDNSVSYEIEVKNKGNVNDSIKLSISKLPPFWTGKLNSNLINLQPKSINIIFLNLTAPANATYGVQVSINILGESLQNPSCKSNVIIKSMVELIRKMILFCNKSEKNANPGEETIYILRVTNQGNAPDLINLSTSEFKWNISLNYKNVTLYPFESREIRLKHKAPNIAIANTTDQGVITAKSLQSNITDSLKIITVINQIYNISASIGLKYVKTVQNSTINSTMNISNYGNGYEVITLLINNFSYNIKLNFNHNVTKDFKINLNPFEKKQIDFSIIIPKDIQPDEYKIEIILLTKIKNFTFKMYFDILLDSDNDKIPDGIDVFPNNPLYAFDSDYDGIPDAWEVQYGLDPFNFTDSHSDWDNDRMTSLEEFISGTDPTNPDYYPNGSYPYYPPEKDKDKNTFPILFQFYIILTIIIILSLTPIFAKGLSSIFTP